MKFLTALCLTLSFSAFAGSYDVHYKLSFNDPSAELLIQGRAVDLKKDCAGKEQCKGVVRDVVILDQLTVEAFSLAMSGEVKLELVKSSGIDTDPVGTTYPVETVSVRKNYPSQEYLYPFINNEQLR